MQAVDLKSRRQILNNDAWQKTALKVHYHGDHFEKCSEISIIHYLVTLIFMLSSKPLLQLLKQHHNWTPHPQKHWKRGITQWFVTTDGNVTKLARWRWPSWTPSWIPAFAQQYSTGTHLFLKLYHMRSQNQSKPHMGPSERGSGHWLPDYASLLLKIISFCSFWRSFWL